MIPICNDTLGELGRLNLSWHSPRYIALPDTCFIAKAGQYSLNLPNEMDDINRLVASPIILKKQVPVAIW